MVVVPLRPDPATTIGLNPGVVVASWARLLRARTAAATASRDGLRHLTILRNAPLSLERWIVQGMSLSGRILVRFRGADARPSARCGREPETSAA